MPHDFVAPGAHWKLEGDKYIQYKYGPGQLAKEWRDLTKMQRTTDAFIPSSDMKDTRKRLLPKLFGTGGALCLWPPNEEIIKQKGADDEEDEGEDQEEGAGLQQHEKLEKQLRVRVARKACNYLFQRAPPLSQQELNRANSAIATFFEMSSSETTKELTQEEFECWVPNEIPIVGNTAVLYHEAMTQYQSLTNDILDMLSPNSEQYTSDKLDATDMLVLETVRNVVIGGVGPLLEVDDSWQEYRCNVVFETVTMLPKKKPGQGEPEEQLVFTEPDEGWDEEAVGTIISPDGEEVELTAAAWRMAQFTLADLVRVRSYMNRKLSSWAKAQRAQGHVVQGRTAAGTRISKRSAEPQTAELSRKAAITQQDIDKRVSITDNELKIGPADGELHVREVEWHNAHHVNLTGIIKGVKGSFKGGIMVACDGGPNQLFENPALPNANGEAEGGGPLGKKPKYKEMYEKEKVTSVALTEELAAKNAELEALKVASANPGAAGNGAADAAAKLEKNLKKFNTSVVTTIHQKLCGDPIPQPKGAIIVAIVPKLLK